MGWIFLLISICFEVGWASTLKYTGGYSRLWPSIGSALLAIDGMYTLSQAVKTLPISITYCIWTGASAVMITILGRILFNEQLGLVQIAFIALIILGMAGLKFVSGG